MSDLIERQAAIETVKKHYRVDNDLLEVIAYEIEALPSAQLAQDLPNGCTDTISRAAALSALNGLTKIFLNNLPPTIDRADAVDAIKALPSAQPGWIPVTERLPEEDTEVLVTVYFMGLKQTSPSGWNVHIRPNYYVDLASRIGNEWSSASDEYKVARDRHKVVAWQPKPKPWKGGQDG